ncbi:MAG: hypothetical protein R3A13_11380 [Bdellovibrionota bacterium]
MKHLRAVCHILLKISPAFLGPIFLLYPAPSESPFAYFESYILFLIFLLACYLMLNSGKRISPNLTKTKRFFFTGYTLISLFAILASLTLLRERVPLEIFVLAPIILALASIRDFFIRFDKIAVGFLLETACFLSIGLLSCSLYIAEIRWQAVLISLAIALQVISSSLANYIHSRFESAEYTSEGERKTLAKKSLVSLYTVCISFPAVIIASLAYTSELSHNYLAVLATLFFSSKLIVQLRDNSIDTRFQLKTDLIGLLFMILCFAAGLI